jgi:26S proteasome subunit RPN7
MLPFYLSLVDQFKWEVNQELVDKLQASNNETLKTLDDKVKDAEENLGESEIRDALLARAEFFSRIGDKVISISTPFLSLPLHYSPPPPILSFLSSRLLYRLSLSSPPFPPPLPSSSSLSLLLFPLPPPLPSPSHYPFSLLHLTKDAGQRHCSLPKNL